MESDGGKTFHELVDLPQVQVDSVSAFHRRLLLASPHMIKMGGQLTGTCHKDISIIHSVSVFPHELIISPKTSFLMLSSLVLRKQRMSFQSIQNQTRADNPSFSQLAP